MKFKTLIPKLFYADAGVGLDLFVNGLGFAVLYEEKDSEHPFFILGNGNAKLHIVQDAEFAAKDRPEIRLETDDIESAFSEVQANRKDLLHPKLKRIKDQPWGLREFALLDSSGVCVIVQQ